MAAGYYTLKEDAAAVTGMTLRQLNISLGHLMLPFIEQKQKQFTRGGGVVFHCDDLQPEDIFRFSKNSPVDQAQLTKDYHVTEFSAMTDGPGLKLFKVFKAGLQWSTLALMVKDTDSEEHKLDCGNIYRFTQGQATIKTFTGENWPLEEVQIKAQKK